MGISLGHLVVILIIVMVIWGPSRLGGLGRGIGEAVRGFKKGMNADDSIDVTPSVQPSQQAQHDQIRDVNAQDSTAASSTSTSSSKDRTRS